MVPLFMSKIFVFFITAAQLLIMLTIIASWVDLGCDILVFGLYVVELLLFAWIDKNAGASTEQVGNGTTQSQSDFAF